MSEASKEQTVRRAILKYAGADLFEAEDEIATEYVLTIMLNDEEFATVVCTPSDLDELIVGFLASEGIIRQAKEITRLDIREHRGFAYVELVHAPADMLKLHSKRFIGSCCGKSRQFYLHSDVRTARTIMTRQQIPIRQCISLMSQLQASSEQFRRTGGMHNAALCTQDGVMLVRSDIGRHNTLDKLFGHCLLHGVPTGDKLIAFSGRISSEVLLKAAKIGCGIVLSKSAPTDLALDLADELGITTLGFIRGGGCNVYTHSERIIVD